MFKRLLWKRSKSSSTSLNSQPSSLTRTPIASSAQSTPTPPISESTTASSAVCSKTSAPILSLSSSSTLAPISCTSLHCSPSKQPSLQQRRGSKKPLNIALPTASDPVVYQAAPSAPLLSLNVHSSAGFFFNFATPKHPHP
jgi:hypothetical protein